MGRDREISIRITFEDTLLNQRNFRNLIEKLIEEKRPLYANEREKYLNLLFKATLSVGRALPFIHILPNGKQLMFGRLIYFAQKLAYYEYPVLRINYRGEEFLIPIEDIWKTFHDYLLRIYPSVQSEALRLGPERFRAVAKPGAVEYTPGSRNY